MPGSPRPRVGLAGTPAFLVLALYSVCDRKKKLAILFFFILNVGHHPARENHLKATTFARFQARPQVKGHSGRASSKNSVEISSARALGSAPPLEAGEAKARRTAARDRDLTNQRGAEFSTTDLGTSTIIDPLQDGHDTQTPCTKYLWTTPTQGTTTSVARTGRWTPLAKEPRCFLAYSSGLDFCWLHTRAGNLAPELGKAATEPVRLREAGLVEDGDGPEGKVFVLEENVDATWSCRRDTASTRIPERPRAPALSCSARGPLRRR